MYFADMSFDTFHIKLKSTQKYKCAITGKECKMSEGWYGTEKVFISDEGVKEIIEQYFFMHRADEGGGTSNFLRKLEHMYNTGILKELYSYRIHNFLREKVLKKYKHQCYICGSKYKLEIDHIIPFYSGGLTELKNLQVLCEKCNLKKRNQKLTRDKRLKSIDLNDE